MLQKSQSKGHPREYWMFMEAYFFMFIKSKRGAGVVFKSAHWGDAERRRARPFFRSLRNGGSVISASFNTRWSTSPKSSWFAVNRGPPATTFTPSALHRESTVFTDSPWMFMALRNT